MVLAAASALLGLLVGVLISYLWHTKHTRKHLQERHEFDTRIAQQNAEIGFLSQQHQDQQQQISSLTSRLEQKSHQVIQLHTQQQERERAHHQQVSQFEQQKQQLSHQFEHLAQKIFNANGSAFSKTQEQSVKLLLEPFQQQLGRFGQQVEQFQHAQVSSHASLNNELKHLKALNQQITHEASNLSKALKGDKKLTGSWGEIQLERCLQATGLAEGVHYQREANFVTPQGQNRRPDFIVKLPDNKHIIIDSKMSLVAYDAAVAADNDADQHAALERHVRALRKHIDALAQKDYSALNGTNSPHFVLMYLAVEPAFIDALKHDATLYDYGSEKNIILVSNTTLLPVLKTVSNLWLLERSHSQAFALAEKAGDIYQQVSLIAERLTKLGRSLQTVSNHYNDTVTAVAGRQGLYGKVERFGELAKQSSALPDIETIHGDIETHKLRDLTENLD
ncbi:MAG TPA: DNA recombination protein RmuC [Marinagarivorans sp.]